MKYYYTIRGDPHSYLSHHGILGMKWGVRRFQNYDGTRIKSAITNIGSKVKSGISAAKKATSVANQYSQKNNKYINAALNIKSFTKSLTKTLVSGLGKYTSKSVSSIVSEDSSKAETYDTIHDFAETLLSSNSNKVSTTYSLFNNSDTCSDFLNSIAKSMYN